MFVEVEKFSSDSDSAFEQNVDLIYIQIARFIGTSYKEKKLHVYVNSREGLS